MRSRAIEVSPLNSSTSTSSCPRAASMRSTTAWVSAIARTRRSWSAAASRYLLASISPGIVRRSMACYQCRTETFANTPCVGCVHQAHCASTGQICQAFQRYVHGQRWQPFAREPSAKKLKDFAPRTGGRPKLPEAERKRRRAASVEKSKAKKKMAARVKVATKTRATRQRERTRAGITKPAHPPAAVDLTASRWRSTSR